MHSLLLVAHGSRREASNEEIRALAERLQRRSVGRFDQVRCAFLELAAPSIAEGMHECIEQGSSAVTVIPYFLASGRHVASDIPAAVRRVAVDHPQVTVTIAPHLGAAESITDLILRQAGLSKLYKETDHASTDH